MAPAPGEAEAVGTLAVEPGEEIRLHGRYRWLQRWWPELVGSSQVCNGGGGSDVRVGGMGVEDRVIVGGGGGGVSGESGWGDGGDGGGGSCGSNYCGGEGGDGYRSSVSDGGYTGGSGSSSSHGGAGGGGGFTSGGGGLLRPHTVEPQRYGYPRLRRGGAGPGSGGCCRPYGAAGGGGGYWGGGGVAGGCCGGGGAGGGSSWTGDLASPSFSAGINSGEGYVVISW